MTFNLQYNWLKEFVRVPTNPHDLARELSLYGPSVERVVHTRHEWTKVIVGEIVKIERHANADKLQVATVRISAKEERVIVCGAPNIAVGQKVPVAIPGAILPGNFQIARREVRGVASDGMICSARELGLHDEHTGILVLHPSAKVGVALESLGTKEDDLLEVEPTTNRPDIQAVIGVAREVSAITGEKLVLPQPKTLSKKGTSPLTLHVEEKTLCRRFSALRIDGVSVTSSPWWMQERLSRAGIRPINGVVDITNYVMLEYGQPLHAFDAQKLGNSIVVRKARRGESLKALDGKTYELEPGHLVVADREKPVAIAGVMGGESTGVDDQTTSVILECATFDPVSIRRTSRGLRLLTEASQLFEKGLSTEAPTPAMARAVELLVKHHGGTIAGPVVDFQAKPYRATVIKFPLSELKRLLGLDIPVRRVSELLKHLGFGVKGSGTTLTVTVPYWRDNDIFTPEDIVEEVARLYGYQNFPTVLPPLSLESAGAERPFARETSLRHALAALGCTEIMSNALVRESWLKALRYPLESGLKVENPLSSDMVYMRPSLLPSLVHAVQKNIVHAREMHFFELANVFLPGSTSREPIEAYRREEMRWGAVVVGAGSVEEQYRHIKGIAEHIFATAGLVAEWRPSAQAWPFAEKASAEIYIEEKSIGHVGLLEPKFLEHLGVTTQVSAIDLQLQPFIAGVPRRSFEAIARYPVVKRDIALVITRDLSYTQVVEAMRVSSALLVNVELFDIYRGDGVAADQQSFAFHLTYRHNERTLEAEEVEAALSLLKNNMSALGATIRA